jgi:hypothetical protein
VSACGLAWAIVGAGVVAGPLGGGGGGGGGGTFAFWWYDQAAGVEVYGWLVNWRHRRVEVKRYGNRTVVDLRVVAVCVWWY